MSKWYVGQKVVCVDASGQTGPSVHLQAGNIYTIKMLRGGCCNGVWIDVGLGTLTGLTRCFTCNDTHPGRWHSDARFRPLEPLKEEMDRIEESFIEEPEYA